jgi:zinc finger protein 830
VQETEAEKRARLAREEREEIMDRLEEEERAQ